MKNMTKEEGIKYLRNVVKGFDEWADIFLPSEQVEPVEKIEYQADIDTLEKFQKYVEEEWSMVYGGMRIEGNYLIISTGGWSDNESKLRVLRRTAFWMSVCTWERAGGHYYFWLGDKMSEDSWFIPKVEPQEEKEKEEVKDGKG